jgi:hypothetical protein
MANPVILRTSSSGGLRPASSQAVPGSPTQRGVIDRLPSSNVREAAGLGCYMSSVADSDFFTLTNLM